MVYFFCIVLAQLCGFLTCVVQIIPAYAEEAVGFEESQPPVQQLTEILVSDTRLTSIQENILTVPAKVTVITAEDIRRSGARTVQEAVEKATGIVQYDQVGNAFEQRVDLRGYNGLPVPSTSVFVDGVRVNEPEFNSINFDLIPLETVERIEIIPYASAVYGKNAMGGAINILTKRGSEKRQITGETAFGSFGRERYEINTTGEIGKIGDMGTVDYYGNFSRELEDGYRDDSDASLWRGFGKLGYRPRAGTDLMVSYTYIKDKLKQAGSLPLDIASDDPKANFTPGDFVDRENNFVRGLIRQELPAGFLFTGNGFYRRLQEESFLVSQPFTVGGNNSTSQNLVDTDSWGGTFQLSHTLDVSDIRNELVVGGEVTWNDFGNKLLSLSDFGPFRIRRTAEEEVTGIFFQDSLHLGSQLVLVGGFRYDRNELEFRDHLDPANDGRKTFSRVTPRAGVTLLFTPQTSLYFSYSRGFRVPTTDELFAQGPFGSNPNLDPVRSHNYEIGFKSKISSWADLMIAVYQSDIRDEIFFTCMDCDFSFGDGQNRNVKKTRRRGFEVTFNVKPNEYFDGVVNYTFTEAQFRSPFNITSTRIVEVGDSFPLVPKHRLAMTGTVHPLEGLSLSLSGLYVSTQFLQGDENNVQDRLQGYIVLNGNVSYERRVWGGILKGFLSINNILDNNYFTSGIYAVNNITGGGANEQFVVPAPGIGVFGGLNYRFEWFPF